MLYTPAPPLSSMISFCSFLDVARGCPSSILCCTEAGITGGRATLSLGSGCDTLMPLSASTSLPAFSDRTTLVLTLCSSRASHATVLTPVTPSSLRVEHVRKVTVGPLRVSIRAFSSLVHMSVVLTSDLLNTTMRGFPSNRGLMLWKSETCSLMVNPHCSLRSMKYRMAARRCTRAVTACISIVLRWSSEWSRMPGVSMTCHRRYL
mmetsp:Transcript_7164/g.16420  ORF Transcript_7164/g.16420 Transcript_7164/m.16420 type:complete len:206 (-) Transcript_7164:742-1359(-)